MSQTGTFEPMKLPEWITGRSGVPLAMPKGECPRRAHWPTAITSGRDLKMPPWMEALEIDRALFFLHGVPVEIELDDVLA
jgi:hypothetical protein